MFNRKKKCKHEWIALQEAFIITQEGKQFPRLPYVCKKCGIAIHKPIYNQSILKKVERKDDDEDD